MKVYDLFEQESAIAHIAKNSTRFFLGGGGVFGERIISRVLRFLVRQMWTGAVVFYLWDM